MTDQAAIDALVARAMPRERVILAALPDHTEPRLDHVERHDVMVIPKEDWIQILIWLAAWVPASPVRDPAPPERIAEIRIEYEQYLGSREEALQHNCVAIFDLLAEIDRLRGVRDPSPPEPTK